MVRRVRFYLLALLRCVEGRRLPVLHVHAEMRVWGVQHQRQEDLWSVLTLLLWTLAPLLACSGPRATVALILTPRCWANARESAHTLRAASAGGRHATQGYGL